MSGSLILIDETTVTSSTSSVTLGGANWDSSFNVYKVIVSNVVTDTDTKALHFRHLDSSNNPITTADYDVAFKVLRSDTTYEDAYGTNQTFGFIVDNYIGTETGEVANGVLYLFDSNNASEHTFHTVESVYRNNSGHLRGAQGGGMLTSNVVTKGVSIFITGGNIASGKFSLYGLKK